MIPAVLFMLRCSEPKRKTRQEAGFVRIVLAETEGFEPSMGLYTPYSLSRGAPSATRSRFLCADYLTTQPAG